MCSGEDVGDMYAGDVSTVHHHHPPPEKKSGGGMSTIGKLAVGAGLLAGGAGLGGAVISALRPPVAVNVPADTDTQYELSFGDE